MDTPSHCTSAKRKRVPLGGLRNRRISIIGINVFHGDAAAMLSSGRLVAGVEEERFTHVKHWAGFPERAIRHCLGEVGANSLDGIDAIAVSRQPFGGLSRTVLAMLFRKGCLARGRRTLSAGW